MREELGKEFDIEYLIKLTSAVYRVTELFLEKELKFKVRESANRVLADLICSQNSGSDYPVKELLELFKKAEAKKWIDSRNFLVLQREYGKIQKLFSKSLKKIKFNNSRQREIYNILKEKKNIQLRELMPSFSQVSRRTLVRDLEELCRAGVVKKNGEGAGTNYLFNV